MSPKAERGIKQDPATVGEEAEDFRDQNRPVFHLLLIRSRGG